MLPRHALTDKQWNQIKDLLLDEVDMADCRCMNLRAGP